MAAPRPGQFRGAQQFSYGPFFLAPRRALPPVHLTPPTPSYPFPPGDGDPEAESGARPRVFVSSPPPLPPWKVPYTGWPDGVATARIGHPARLTRRGPAPRSRPRGRLQPDPVRGLPEVRGQVPLGLRATYHYKLSVIQVIVLDSSTTPTVGQRAPGTFTCCRLLVPDLARRTSVGRTANGRRGSPAAANLPGTPLAVNLQRPGGW